MANTFKFGNGNWAVKDGYALAYNDENGNFKPLPFDFTRASSATRVNKQGLIENVPSGKPRIDFLNNTSGHLLLEPSRTNRVPYSVFDADVPTGWSVGFGTGTFTHELTTFRGQSAIKHTQLTSGRSYLQDSVILSAGTTYTCSFYVDLENSGDIPSNEVIASVNFSDDTGDDEVTFGEIDQDTGLAKFTFTTVTDIVGELRLGFGCFGTTSTTNKPLIFSMPQIEEGSYPTSYIPTEGSSVTRSAETANGAGNSTVFNDSEGVLFIEGSLFTNSGENNYFSIGDTTGTRDSVELHFRTESNRIRGIIYSNNSVTINISTYSFNKTNNNKIAFKYKDNDFAIWVNGTEAVTSSSGAAPLKLSNLQFADANNGNIWYGKCKQVLVFNEALTDTELQNLTS